MEDEDFETEIGTVSVYFKEKTSHIIEIPIIGDIGPPEQYSDLVYHLRNAKPEDEIELLINSDGGRVDGALHIVHGIQSCQAKVIKATITGTCASAATFPFFAADCWEISPFASMLLHSTSYGTMGMTPHIHSLSEHEKAHLSKMCDLFYKHFLTEKEIRGLLRGDQLYFMADEIGERLNKRIKKLMAEEKRNAKQHV